MDYLGWWDNPVDNRFGCRWWLIRYSHVDLQHVPGTSPSQALATALEMVRDAAETLWSARSDDELVDTVGLVTRLTAALAAVEASAVAEVDARDLATTRLAYGSTGDWLTHLGGLRKGEGKRRVVRAKALTGPLARTREALVAGTVSPGQADLIVAAVAELPPGDWTRRRGEKLMVRQAAHLDATELARAGRHLVEVVDPDAVDRRLQAGLEREERAAHLDRHLWIGVRPGRWGPDPRPRVGRGRCPPQGRAPPPHPTREPTRQTGSTRWTRRPANPARRDNPANRGGIRGRPEPAVGTPSSPWPNTP